MIFFIQIIYNVFYRIFCETFLQLNDFQCIFIVKKNLKKTKKTRQCVYIVKLFAMHFILKTLAIHSYCKIIYNYLQL